MTTPARSPTLWPAVFFLVATAATSAAAATSSRRACIRGCATDLGSCLALARTRGSTLRGACTGNHAARAKCRHTARVIVHLSTRGCHQLRKDCRACCRTGGEGPQCPVGRPVAFGPPAPQDLGTLGVPRLDDGRFFLLAIPNALLAIDPTLKNPATALGACTRWITSCVDPTSRSLDDCARSAPPCATAQPWEEPDCCPAACFDAYQTARRAGAEPMAAFSTVYFQDASCFPGLRALLGGGQ